MGKTNLDGKENRKKCRRVTFAKFVQKKPLTVLPNRDRFSQKSGNHINRKSLARQMSKAFQQALFPLLQSISQHRKKKMFGVWGVVFLLLHLQQDGGTQGNNTGGAGEHDLAGTGSDNGRLGRGVRGSALGDGAVVVGSGGGRARDRGHGSDGLGDRARAVRDGQGGGRGDGVGLAVVGQDRGLRAVGGQSRDDLGRVGDVGGTGRDGSGESQDGSKSELHFDGWVGCREDGLEM